MSHPFIPAKANCNFKPAHQQKRRTCKDFSTKVALFEKLASVLAPDKHFKSDLIFKKLFTMFKFKAPSGVKAPLTVA